MIKFYFSIGKTKRYIVIPTDVINPLIYIYKDEKDYETTHKDQAVYFDLDLNLTVEKKLQYPGTVEYLQYVQESYKFIEHFASIIRENRFEISKWTHRKRFSKKELKLIDEMIVNMQSWANIKFNDKRPVDY